MFTWPMQLRNQDKNSTTHTDALPFPWGMCVVGEWGGSSSPGIYIGQLFRMKDSLPQSSFPFLSSIAGDFLCRSFNFLPSK